jgi:hypothetical protein
MEKVFLKIRHILAYSWMPLFLSVMGGVVYLWQAVQIARTTTSFLDEGMYLYKGWLFVNGMQTPFADYGVQTNHSILSFLLPGIVEKIFGPGLDTGRYFMIFVSMFTLLGLWVFAKRWGNAWWAVGIIWAMALNPAEIKLHSMVLTEGPVAAMMVWMLVLVIGEERPLWQILLGSALATVVVMTRETMIFVPPILFLYIFWQHGWKKGLYAMLASGVLFIAVNAFYFPDNLKFWAMRAPRSVTPFLDKWRTGGLAGGEGLGESEETNLYRQILYFFLTFRLHFVTLISAFAAWLLWPFKQMKPLTERMRAGIFLSVLFLVLFAVHMLASLTFGYCISCGLLYIGYCDFIGLMLFVIAAPFFVKELSRLRQFLIAAFIVIFTLGIGFSAQEDVSGEFARVMIERLDPFYVWNAALYVTGLAHLVLFRLAFVIGSSLLFLAVGGVLLWGGYRRLGWKQASAGKTALVAINGFLIAGLILSPTKALGLGNDFFDCDGQDVFASYERAGQALSEVIEPGSKVYWEGRIPAIFLYLPDVRIYPPQLNHVHSYKVGGDPEILLRSNRWNDALAEQWLAEADYILVQKTELVYLTNDMLESGKYKLVLSPPSAEKCRWQSVVHVYQRADQ